MPTSFNKDEDALLLVQLCGGNHLAFNALYKKYWSFVFNSAYKRLKDVSLAEDVTQDVFTQLWCNAQNSEIRDLPGYLFISVRNRVIRLMEREGRYKPVPEILDNLKGMAESADATLLYRELKLACESLIADFSQQQQVIFKLKYFNNYTADQIAAHLGLSPKTVRNQIGKMNQKIRSSIVSACVLAAIAHFMQ